MFAYLLPGLLLASCALGRPRFPNVFSDEDDEDLGVIDVLASSFGDQIFATPTTRSGEAVSKWNSSSGHNPEELGEYPQGDILFPAKRSRNGLKASSARWPGGIVPYVISGSFTSKDLSMIQDAFNGYHKKTCVKFVKRTTQSDYLKFTSSQTGCWSSVGRVGGGQEINLQSPGCLVKEGTVMHEMMHALGFLHEQNRWERDTYVSVMYQNIIPGRETNFEKAKESETDALGIGYDYASVMHYSDTAFSVNGGKTIVPRQNGVVLGQRDTLSKQDIQKIRRMYKCKKHGGSSGIANV